MWESWTFSFYISALRRTGEVSVSIATRALTETQILQENGPGRGTVTGSAPTAPTGPRVKFHLEKAARTCSASRRFHAYTPRSTRWVVETPWISGLPLQSCTLIKTALFLHANRLAKDKIQGVFFCFFFIFGKKASSEQREQYANEGQGGKTGEGSVLTEDAQPCLGVEYRSLDHQSSSDVVIISYLFTKDGTELTN